MTNIDEDDIKDANQGGMDNEVILYVLLRTQDLFNENKRAGKDAWRDTYPLFRLKTSDKEYSDMSVTLFIEALRLRFKPKVGVPTGNLAELGDIHYGPGIKIIDPEIEYPDLLETPKKEGTKIDFEYSEDPTDTRVLDPYKKEGEVKEKEPTPSEPSKPTPENPGDILEDPKITPPS